MQQTLAGRSQESSGVRLLLLFRTSANRCLILKEAMRIDWSDERLIAGLKCYDAGEYFEAHEHWELVWLELDEPEKTFMQALIQVAAAFEHWRRGEPEGTRSLLKRVVARLEKYPAEFAGVDVEALRRSTGEWLEGLPEVKELAVPKIQGAGIG
ncbi:MAG TPA: DUF309 domain-containing protein [Terracidiphilus sp.]|nr:DUF309 domain-containing protein [Terracidiphilus sp.]